MSKRNSFGTASLLSHVGSKSHSPDVFEELVLPVESFHKRAATYAKRCGEMKPIQGITREIVMRQFVKVGRKPILRI